MGQFRKVALVNAEQVACPVFVPAGQVVPPPPMGMIWEWRQAASGPGLQLVIQTKEGPHEVTAGDWRLGPGPHGEFWVVKEEIFRDTYRPVMDGDKDASLVLSELLEALAGIEWSAGSSPSPDVLRAIEGRARDAIKQAAEAGFRPRPHRAPSGPGTCDMDPMDPRFRRPAQPMTTGVTGPDGNQIF